MPPKFHQPPPGPGGRSAGCAPVVDPHDQPVDALAHALERELERQVGAGVAAELVPVEPHGGVVVDRLEADDPAAEAGRHVARRSAELGSVKSRRYQPTEPAMLAALKSPALKELGTRHRRPARRCWRRCATSRPGHPDVAGIGPVEPLAAEQVAIVLAVGIQRALGRRRGRVAGPRLGARGGADASAIASVSASAASARGSICAPLRPPRGAVAAPGARRYNRPPMPVVDPPQERPPATGSDGGSGEPRGASFARSFHNAAAISAAVRSVLGLRGAGRAVGRRAADRPQLRPVVVDRVGHARSPIRT